MLENDFQHRLICFLLYRLTPFVHSIGSFRSLRFTVGWPLKSCAHTVIFPSVSGPSAVRRKPRKVPIFSRHEVVIEALYQLYRMNTTLVVLFMRNMLCILFSTPGNINSQQYTPLDILHLWSHTQWVNIPFQSHQFHM